MTIKSRDYWKQRFLELEEDQYRLSEAYRRDVEEQYRKAINDVQRDIAIWYQRLADNNGISLASAKKLLKADELDEFHWSVWQYIRIGKEHAVNQKWMVQLENASANYHISRLTAMKIQMQQHAELLATQFEGGMTEFLKKAYKDRYYKTAFEIAKGTNVGSSLAKIDTRKIEQVLNHPWAQDGKRFSDRIWEDKEKLVRELHTELSRSVIRGEPPKAAIDRLSHTMKVKQSQAGRLIMTESAAIASVSQRACFKELQVDEFEVVETLDDRTCEICRDMDGKHFPMSDFRVGETAPPFHPRCRGCTAPYFDDEFSGGERAARDPETGKTVYVPADMTYREWENQFLNDTYGAEKRGRTVSELQDTNEKYLEITEKYSTRESKWSGKVVVDDRKCQREKIAGRKLWNCDILLKSTASDKTIIHEQLHARSGSYMNPVTIIPYSSIEEASVEFLAREICRAEGISFKALPNERVSALRQINSIVHICETDLDFAIALFGKDIRRRYRWLEQQIEKREVADIDNQKNLAGLLKLLRGTKK